MRQLARVRDGAVERGSAGAAARDVPVRARIQRRPAQKNGFPAAKAAIVANHKKILAFKKHSWPPPAK
jgi:hypothetical protein